MANHVQGVLDISFFDISEEAGKNHYNVSYFLYGLDVVRAIAEREKERRKALMKV